MEPKQPKKMLTLNILEILKKYTDEDHKLSQEDIIEHLEKDYGMKADRKAVKRNLMNLIESGYDIECVEKERMNHGQKEMVCTEWYFNHDFTDSELRLLIDDLLFSKYIPRSQCKELIEKLEGLSSKYFRSKVKHIQTLPKTTLNNKELFRTIEVLNEAITEQKQVEFFYEYYDISERKMKPRQNEEGIDRRYIINPYQIVMTNGRYYLMGTYDTFDNISHYRLDRISQIKLRGIHAKPRNEIKDLGKSFDLSQYMAEHIYMFSDDSIRVKFRAARNIVTDIVDWFGVDVVFSNVTDAEVDVAVKVNQDAVFYWLMQYGPFVEVLEPLALRERVKTAVEEMAKKYSESS